MATLTTYLPTDLQRRYRTVLDAARAGQARVRDQDGTNLLVLPEQRVEALRQLVHAAANLALVERVLENGGTPLDAHLLGDWTWLRVFDGEDLREFVADLREAIAVGAGEESSEVLDAQLHAWRVSARQLEDPIKGRILLGRPAAEDFVEVSAPGDPGRV